MRKHPNSHREAKATAPVLDSTRHSTQNALGRGLSLYPHISTRFLYAACRRDSPTSSARKTSNRSAHSDNTR
jgi:hypothetical protein